MPEPLHAALAKASQSEGVSLNTYITEVLANAVGSQGTSLRPRGRTRHAAEAAPVERNRRLFPTLLVANLVIVAAVGIVALALLIEALR